MGTSLLSLGAGALGAAQAGVMNAGNNIANANTPGYSRQRVEQAPNMALYSGVGYFGQGVHLQSVTRQYDALLASEYRLAQSQASYSQAYSAQAGRIDAMLGDSAGGISAAMDEFFSGVANLTSGPSDPSARQAMLSAAQTLTGRLQEMSGQLSTLRASTNDSVRASVEEINGIATQVAQLNQQIAVASQGGRLTPNDLMDKRDALVGDLAKQINGSVVKSDTGDYNVFVGNGQPLVLGARAQAMVVRPDPLDAANVQVGLKNGASIIAYGRGSVTGGILGGLLEFRDQTLGEAQNAVGRVALALGSAFNEQQKLGLDANGVAGTDLFSLGTPTVLTTSAATLSATVTDYSALTASDYRMKFDGTNYTLTRSSDGTQTTFATFPQTIDGVTYDVAPPSPAAATNDSFLVQPTRNGAASLAVLFTDPRRVATAAPVRTAASATNTGSATISAGAVTPAYPATPLAAAQTLTYAALTGTLSGFPGGSAVTSTLNGVSTTYAAGAPVPYVAGATLEWDGMQVQWSGAPANGDKFSIAPNSGATGDNRNALALAALQTTRLLGGATVQQAFGQLVATVGNKAHQMQVASTAQASLARQVQAAGDSVSGVNLDEEAADLLRYQQAYQAAGKMFGIAATLFDTILNIQR